MSCRSLLSACAALVASAGLAAETWEFSVPPTAVRRTAVNGDWREYASLQLELQLLDGPSDGSLQCSFFLENKQDLWFQSVEPVLLGPKPVLVRVRLDEGSPDLCCMNARRPFDTDALRWVRSWGLTVFSEKAGRARVQVGDVRLVRAGSRSPALTDVAIVGAAVTGDVQSVTFRLSGFAGNPFCSEAVRGRLFVLGSDGETAVPAYYSQDYVRTRHPGSGQWRIEARSAPAWRADWLPRAEGVYRLRLDVTADGTRLEKELGEVTVRAGPPAPRAAAGSGETAERYVRANEDLLFEWRNGRWTRAGEAGGGGRYWDLRLDWTPAWGRFTGLGEFDLLSAWQFEQALAACDRQARLPIVVFDEDDLDDQGVYNWVDNPLNRRNGGRLQRPHQAYTDPEFARIVLDRARYLAARYGRLPAVSGLLVGVSGLEQETVAWVNALAAALAREFPAMPVFCGSPGLPERARARPLDLDRAWTTDPRLAPGTRVTRNRATGETLVSAANAETAAVVARVVQHWAGESAFACDIFTPVTPDDSLKVLGFVRTDANTVFQSPLVPLGSERWNRVQFPLDRPDRWTCLQDGSRRLTPYDLLNMREIGLRFFGSRPDRIGAGIRGCTLLGPYRFEVEARAPLAIGRLTGAVEEVPQYEKFELQFHLNRVFNNPYDPGEIDVGIELTGPGGQRRRHPGFFLEPWRLDAANGRETASPAGAPVWCVRVSPIERGPHEWHLTARAGDEVALATGRFTCVPGSSRGFVRVSAKDPRYFEFSDGSFYYPIGHNLRSPGDSRSEKQGRAAWENSEWALRMGTRAYEKWLARMRASGENFTRVWMCPWWCGLEWNQDHPGYHGLGYYNQANAARLDRLLELAEREGVYVNLETMNHGALSTRVDDDWTGNPLSQSTQPGGFLRYATQFFDSRRAQELHRQRLRYTVARWGYSRAIAWWGVMTETEWVEAYFRSVRGRGVERELPYAEWIPRPYESHDHKEKVVEWISQIGGYIRETDAHPHPVTAHFSMPFYGQEVWSRPNVDIVHNNTYTECVKWWHLDEFDEEDGIADIMFVFARYYDPYARRKPLMVGEWGGSPYGSRADHLQAELHTGIWVMAMTRCAGVAGFWWWNFVDAEDLYGQFKAVAAFTAGEDRRGRNEESSRARLSFPDAQGSAEQRKRQGVVLASDSSLMAYVFSKAANRRNGSTPAAGADDPGFPPSGRGWLDAPAILKDGRYTVEYWNTFTGTVTATQEVELKPGQRRIPISDHRVDLALKAKPAADRAGR